MILSRFLPALFAASVLFGQSTALPQQAPSKPAPPQDPKILEDGGISIEPIFWLNWAQPQLYGGKTATEYGNLAYTGKSKYAYGGEIGLPLGRANTLRLSYFRTQGNSNSYVGTNGATLFGEAYAAGDYLQASNRIQSAKISWDYLSYTFKNHIRFKTLWEMQYVTISTAIAAPLLGETTDASGNVDTNSSNGSKNLFLPTFGVEFEQALSKHFRWEAKGSGFGLPHRADIWDAQADVAFRMKAVELLIGGKMYHYKTSPRGDEYFIDTLQGAFVGVRYYWGSTQN